MIQAWRFHIDEMGQGGTERIDPALAVPGAHGFVWIHIEADAATGADDQAIFDPLPVTLPEAARRALVAYETRPRCEQIDDGAIINVRGPAADDSKGADPLVSIRMWAERGLLISSCFRPAAIMPDVMADMEAGRFTDPGDVVVGIVSRIAERLDPVVAKLGDDLDDLETLIGDTSPPLAVRQQVTHLRSDAITYRRFIAPQRQAMERLASLTVDWLDDHDRMHAREAADRFSRMSEELEAVRERAAVAHEELTDLRAEKMDSRSLQIAIVALIFLPLTFITGLLGMNVEGIPFAKESWAFWGVVAFCVVVAALTGGWFAWRQWSQR